jgi:hypothetical protein
LVRWEDNGHEAFFFPGNDAIVEHDTGRSASPVKPVSPG